MQSDSRLASDIECTHTLGSIDLMATNGQQVDVHLINIDGHLAHALGRISVEKHLVVAAKLADFFQGLHCADFIVDVNDRADKCVRSDGFLEHVHINEAFRGHRQVSHLEALIFELAAGVQYALVVDLRGDDVALFITVKGGKAFQA